MSPLHGEHAAWYITLRGKKGYRNTDEVDPGARINGT